MTMPQRLLLLLVCVFAAPLAHAQFGNEEAKVRLTRFELPPKVAAGATFEAVAHFSIEREFHIYGLKAVGFETVTEFQLAAGAAGFSLGAARPDRPPERHQDPHNTYDYWAGKVSFTLPVTVTGEAGARELKLVMSYMACTEEFCLPPAELELTGKLEVTPATAASSVAVVQPVADAPPVAVEPPAAKVTGAEAGSVPTPRPVQPQVPPLGDFLLEAMLAALVALITPCVFPMIPITISVFTKQAEKEQGSVKLLGSVYALGIVVSFTAIGALLTLALGQDGASAFSLHWGTQLFIGVLFVVFALSLFGLFDLQLPAALTNLTGGARGKGGVLGVWLLGMLFAVTSFTCTAPFVALILASAATSGEWTRPVLGMVVFSSVLAVPFFFLSIFPGKLKALPKSGGWLNEVKVAMGFVEVMAAFKFIAAADATLGWGVFTRPLVLCIWTVCCLLLGLYLLGNFRLPHDSPRERTSVVHLMLAMVVLILGVYLFRGLLGGNINWSIASYLPPELEGEAMARGDAHAHGQQGEHFKNDYDAARVRARELKLPLFIDFTGYG